MTIQGFSAKVVAALSPLLFAAVFFPQTALSTTFGEIRRFSPSASDNVLFGGAVSISGDTAIVGRDMYNRRGSAYIFRRNSSGAWSQAQEISAGDGSSRDLFGYSVAISGDAAIVGAFGVDRGAGAAYIFEKNSDGTWAQTQRLTADTGITVVYAPARQPANGKSGPLAATSNSERGDGDWYGVSVAISGDTAMAGVPLGGLLTQRVVAGKVYVYEKNSEGEWMRAAVLTASDGAEGDYFGGSVTIQGDTAVIGAYKDDGERGSAYVFEKNSSGAWTQTQKLTAGDRDPSDSFGGSAAISGNTIIVGADEYNFNRDHGAGAAYVFEKNSSGVWAQTQKLTASDAATNDYFGGSVAISGNIALIGAMRDDSRTGSAYVFKKNSSGAWAQTQKLTASDAAAGGLFGYAAAISGTAAIVGASGGTGYVFEPLASVASSLTAETQPEPLGGCAISGEGRGAAGAVGTLALLALAPFAGRFRERTSSGRSARLPEERE